MTTQLRSVLVASYFLMFLLSGAARAQVDWSPLRAHQWAWREPTAKVLWSIADSETSSPAMMNFHQMTGENFTVVGGSVGSGGLPLHRLGYILAVQEIDPGVYDQVWHILITGLSYQFDSNPFPSASSGVIAWIQVRRIGGVYTTAVMASQNLGSMDLTRGVLTDNGLVALDARNREVVASAWTPDWPNVDLPSPGSFSVAGPAGQIAGLTGSPVACKFGMGVDTDAQPLVDAIALVSQVDSQAYANFSYGVSGWQCSVGEMSSMHLLLPAIRDPWALGGTEGISVLVPVYISGPTITLKDDLGATLLSSQSVTSGVWTQLPTVAALNARPGRKHWLDVDGEADQARSFYPTARHGGVVSGNPAVTCSKGWINPSVKEGGRLRAGVYLSHSLPSQSPDKATVVL